MAPLTPHWQQPSHPHVQEVVVNEAEFFTKSYSRVALAPFSVFSKLSFPPCTSADEPTYATVQTGKNSHLNLNSDLLYINHSCEPSLIFDVGNFNVLVGPKGLKPGDELTFFYPSTEWDMAQTFDCLCGTPTCKGRIAGAKDMTQEQLNGLWLNGHIIELRREQERGLLNGNSDDATAEALSNAVTQAVRVVESARFALQTYKGARGSTKGANGSVSNGLLAKFAGSARHGPTSRELGGEMGGDTIRV